MVPCQRKTRTQGRKRRSHDAVRPRQAVRCSNCASWKLPHAACTECGYVRAGLQLKINNKEQ